MNLGIQGKVALVTGGASGIGKAIVLELAREGAHVAFTSRRADDLDEVKREVEAFGVKALPIVADVVVEGEPGRVVAAVQAGLGDVDILVNNVGDTLGILDPENTRTMPPEVAASSGLDILSHAIESFTALPYTGRPMPDRPALRPAYQGSNPISDVWSLQALRMVAKYLVRAVADPSDDDARSQMLLAAAYAGVGFGNAGVHIPHANAYPIAGRVRDFVPDDYPEGEPIIPHGMAVSLTAPAAFRFTFDAAPERHLRAARILDPDASGDGPELLASVVTALMRDVGMPNEDGYDLIMGLRHQSVAIPAVALTAFARPEDRVRSIKAGFAGHLAKPVEPAELLVMVASLAGQYHKR